MSKKKPLSVVPYLPQEQARKDAIEALTTLLAEANRGEIIAVAAVGLRPDGSAHTVLSGCTKPLALLGAIDVMHDRFRQCCKGEEQD